MTKTEQQKIEIRPVNKMAVMQPLRACASILRFRAVLLLLVPSLLIGCAKTGGADNLTAIAQAILPEQTVTDYRLKDCDLIWDISKPAAMENGLYWLRFTDCTDRLPVADAREMAKYFALATWSQVFKQSILINRASPTLAERKRIIENINRYSAQFPVSLRPLLQLWREQQYLKINLAEERIKFQRFQLDSDSKIDRLKDTRARLEYELSLISRKLENLTDIERQLSSRKQEQSNVAHPDDAGQINDAGSSSSQPTPEDKPAINGEHKEETHSPEETGVKQ
ncbi:two-component system QseEF-associated lipoprotein QseG [Xenorhabdus sp. 12]|uniref:Two-component system QseEF-associated lipoprotein QseG n=1 Tax=Xenorhabdus santafensis TaxID=2582833 RepID=A0ABU4SEA0_9GAMM|nr:two-component system QseEF-associated lipoprotein QseG [Xenorhabdus sp. 12]MDX7989112.1 two-component system QseEF-associated lipoprotein QseG [Xenorhabdus sp. 12]